MLLPEEQNEKCNKSTMNEHENDNAKKILNSEHHTLFIQSVAEKRTAVKNSDHWIITPAHNVYHMNIDSFMEFGRGLHEPFYQLRQSSKKDKLVLRINSGGGLVLEGKNFYNLIQEHFNNRTTTILDSRGYSMGALTFCMGNERVIYEHSDLMFHNYAGGTYGKGQEMVSSVNHRDRELKQFFQDVIVEPNFLTPEEFDEMIIGKDFWMNAEEMCQRGIATHVMVGDKKMKAKKYLKLLKNRKKESVK